MTHLISKNMKINANITINNTSSSIDVHNSWWHTSFKSNTTQNCQTLERYYAFTK